ncbi:NADP-dependent oxidoreductase domain-containing protein [Lophiotrema nucula]|uniref:NADP-dependent oxidoreductase domain-containing protein n=1 Tax=Lophiotrema nucula TaxID=690887 RepID=A0A6A5YU31_9PLEO|nr:NADP-dependent oxidoreductase domain-containing protein [Lophiotrema nucula]
MVPEMKYVRVGKSGLKLLDKDEALPILKYAFRPRDKHLGCRVVDTYSNGHSEAILGAAIKHHDIPRSKLVVMSKCFQVNRVGLSRKHVLDAVDRSVERPGTYIEEITKALNDVIESGNVRYIGASFAHEFQMLQNVARRDGWHGFISRQGMYNLLYREEEREMNPYCNASGVGLFPWSPLAAGVLTHPWTDRSDPREQKDPFLQMLFRSGKASADEGIIGRVEEPAKKKGFFIAQIAQAWLMSKGGMPIWIELTADEISYLEELYVPKMPFPF